MKIRTLFVNGIVADAARPAPLDWSAYIQSSGAELKLADASLLQDGNH